MTARKDIALKVSIQGEPHTLFLVDNPTIDDVVAIEARLAASDVENGTSGRSRRVGRDVRDVLIRIGVER